MQNSVLVVQDVNYGNDFFILLSKTERGFWTFRLGNWNIYSKHKMSSKHSYFSPLISPLQLDVLLIIVKMEELALSPQLETFASKMT